MSVPQLRFVTYLCPSIPVELFQSILELLEECTGYQMTLQYEWRSDGPISDRLDPFQNNLVDIAFMPSSGYIALADKKNPFTELLPVTPVFRHPKNEQECAGTYIDVIVHSDKLKHSVNEILDLRGCRWACTRQGTLANNVTLNALRELGENITFFGSTHRTTSHLSSVNMVLTKQVEVASIDASSLACNRRFLHNGAKDVVVLTNFGPFAPYAVVINSRINGDLKNKIVSAFTSITPKDPRFEKFGLMKFAPNHPDAYNIERDYMKNSKSRGSKVPYY